MGYRSGNLGLTMVGGGNSSPFAHSVNAFGVGNRPQQKRAIVFAAVFILKTDSQDGARPKNAFGCRFLIRIVYAFVLVFPVLVPGLGSLGFLVVLLAFLVGVLVPLDLVGFCSCRLLAGPLGPLLGTCWDPVSPIGFYCGCSLPFGLQQFCFPPQPAQNCWR